ARQILRGHEGAVEKLAFTRDGRRLATCARDDTIRLWDLAGNREVVALRDNFQKDAYWVGLSPDVGTLAPVGRDHAIKPWGVGAGRLRAVLRGHEGQVYTLQYSADGTRLTS